jgi:hypothetical protein
MTMNKNYCMGCMKEIDYNLSECPLCGYKADTVQHEPCLKKGSVIAGRYLTGRVTALANDSITYIGLDLQTEEIVTLHEFFPVKIVKRHDNGNEIMVKLGCDAIYHNCLQSFVKLWKGIGELRNITALPKVKNIVDYAEIFRKDK